MDNTQLLTAGARVYAKKRKQRDEQVQEIKFDDQVRRSFLTGFEARKKERKAQAKKKALERERQERLEERRLRREAKEEMKQQRRQEYESYAKQFKRDSDSSDDSDQEQQQEEEQEQEQEDDPWNVQPNSTAQFTGTTSTTTVTVITEVDDEASIDAAARQSLTCTVQDRQADATKIQAQLEKLARLLVYVTMAVAVVATSLVAGWFGATACAAAVLNPPRDIAVVAHRHGDADVNDNQLLRIYPSYSLIGPRHSVRGVRTSYSSWTGCSRTAFFDEHGCTVRISDVKYSLVTGRPYEIRFTDYDKDSRVTSHARATIETEYWLMGTIETIDITMGARQEKIVIKRNWFTGKMLEIVVTRSWGDATVLKPSKCIEEQYLKHERALGLVMVPLW
ncbi:nucleolar protein 12-domain-containing protein [Syncephalis pseudoplumigaleata]|uniref:Nucleolar protein 12-domain-containing protein n=1 Tax=Syncephalis pseudoplumigaleata TaxID=1712513 RepID=A0A4P9YZP5_9FUNG|nr:nucleolar protein 12-domain-containing protein [Syncephalis pseudoplumigaleata]|eukprot:RKP25647.1 nucleolar protein 12-domain-containing protein [Syncephalis pseudoplumigaleata]